jgi:uncharacterized protein YbjT (DUF2867 family)
VILLTGATGVVGSELLPQLLSGGHEVRALVRDPRRLGAQRVNVQIALGDLSDPFSMRHAMRGVHTVIHLAATTRDQPGGTIEELNGLATVRLLRSAERAGVDRFVFFSAIGATSFQRTRFFRAKALAERAVRASPLEPIWAHDVAACVAASLDGADSKDEGENRDANPGRRYELAGPETLSYEEIVEQVLEAHGRERPLLHVPLPLVRAGLQGLGLIAGPSVFATWEEAELFEVPMTAVRGTADARGLGISPRPMREVLGG